MPSFQLSTGKIANTMISADPLIDILETQLQKQEELINTQEDMSWILEESKPSPAKAGGVDLAAAAA